jgi:DNA replication protein DnaC
MMRAGFSNPFGKPLRSGLILAFKEWGTLFDVDGTPATALIDRLMHPGEAILIQGDSYRMKDKRADSISV